MSIALMMEAACTSETSVDIQLRTQQYIPEDSELHTHCRENLKSHKNSVISKNIQLYNKLFIYLTVFHHAGLSVSPQVKAETNDCFWSISRHTLTFVKPPISWFSLIHFKRYFT
jgi:hypothetical protein